MKLPTTCVVLLGTVLLLSVAKGRSRAANEAAAEIRNLLQDELEADEDKPIPADIEDEEKKTLAEIDDDKPITVDIDDEEERALAEKTDDSGDQDENDINIEERNAGFLSYRRTCDAKFKRIPFHSACVTKSSQFVKGGVSRNERNDIVRMHNRLRARVNPRASDMLTLSWDYDLANAAQAWAESCTTSTPLRSGMIIPNKFRMGQNLAQGYRSWFEAIHSWFNERYYFSFGAHYNNKENIEHYTAMVWAKTYKIGCGFAECRSPYKRVYVCNYGPEGNKEIYKGQIDKPYTASGRRSCGECKLCHNNLCYCNSQTVCYGKELDSKTCSCTKPLYMGQ